MINFISAALLFALSNAAQGSPNSETLYEAMPEAALTVEYRDGDQVIAGTEIFERASATQICQKVRPLIPNPPANYFCWERIFTGEEAKFTYEGSDEALTLSVRYYSDGQPIDDLTIYQRGLPSGFCRKQGSAGAMPPYFYSCFNRLP